LPILPVTRPEHRTSLVELHFSTSDASFQPAQKTRVQNAREKISVPAVNTRSAGSPRSFRAFSSKSTAARSSVVSHSYQAIFAPILFPVGLCGSNALSQARPRSLAKCLKPERWQPRAAMADTPRSPDRGQWFALSEATLRCVGALGRILFRCCRFARRTWSRVQSVLCRYI
jgi:hypothetical protein